MDGRQRSRPRGAAFGRRAAQFRARRFSGDDGCNRFGGRYRATGTALRFTDVVTTAIGCEGGPPRISDPIDRVRGYRRSGDRLKLLGRRGRTLAVLQLR